MLFQVRQSLGLEIADSGFFIGSGDFRDIGRAIGHLQAEVLLALAIQCVPVAFKATAFSSDGGDAFRRKSCWIDAHILECDEVCIYTAPWLPPVLEVTRFHPDLAVHEGEEITAVDLQSAAVRFCGGQSPLRAPAVALQEVSSVLELHIR